MSKNELAVIGHDVPNGSRLHQSETELATAIIAETEAWFAQAVILERIQNDEEYRDANYKSFKKYMNDRQPLGMKANFAQRLLRAKSVRLLLPTSCGKSVPMGTDFIWTERAIRPLTHSDFKPSDVRRLGKKIATQVKRGNVLSATLVKEICDKDRGVEALQAEAQGEELDAADSPAKVLRKLKVDVDIWMSSLGKVPEDFWEDAESEDRGCTERAITALSDLVSFLRS